MSTSRRRPDAPRGPRHRASALPPKRWSHAFGVVGGALVIVALAAVVTVIAPWSHRDSAGAPAESTVVVPTPPQEPVALPQPGELVVPSPSTDLKASFDELQNSLGGDIGVSFAPLGRPDAVQQFGTWTHGPAWSTSKVPLSAALLRQDGAEALFGSVRAAITQSDNAAAQAIWEALGAHQTAADKVDAVLREAGDQQTRVQPEVTRGGFSAFGQTDWSLTEQVRFMSYAACNGRDNPVLTLMSQIAPGQRWGLGTLQDARFKGGWGPGTDGSYLVRQFGVVTGPEGDSTVVAMAAVPGSGGFGDGTALLSRMAEWVGDHLGDIGGGRCGEG